MKKVKTRLLAMSLAVFMLFGAAPMTALADTDDTITVIVSFEGFNLGHGFYVVPTAVTLPAGSTALGATEAMLTRENIEYTLSEFMTLERIFGIHPGTAPNPPSYITIALNERDREDDSLGEFDYSAYAGWLFTINHTTPEVGPADLELLDGDVIRWQFSLVGWGADLGMPDFWGEPLYQHADKTHLIVAFALFPDTASEEERQHALDVIINPLATQTEINRAGLILRGTLSIRPVQIVFEVGKTTYTRNGAVKEFDAAPFEAYGLTLVPLRTMAEAIGATVEWQGETQTVYITQGDDTVSLVIGEWNPHGQPARIVQNRTFVSLEHLVELLGVEIMSSWDEDSSSIYVFGG